MYHRATPPPSPLKDTKRSVLQSKVCPPPPTQDFPTLDRGSQTAVLSFQAEVPTHQPRAGAESHVISHALWAGRCPC